LLVADKYNHLKNIQTNFK